MSVLLTNTSARAEPLARALRRGGIAVLREPMLRLHGCPWLVSALGDPGALVVTSPNVASFLAGAPEAIKARPVFAVGPSTGSAMRRAGFSAVISAGGTAVDLVRMIEDLWRPGDGGLAYLSARDVSLDVAVALRSVGYDARRVVVYRASTPGGLSASLRQRFQNGEVSCCVFMSPLAAAHFSALAQGADVAIRSRAVALSSRVAAMLDARCWDVVATAPRPALRSVIQTVATMMSDRTWRPFCERAVFGMAGRE